MTHKKRVAVFFGGRSPEHDVSVVSGLQILQAIDTHLYDPFPVYVTPAGQWFVGEALRSRSNYVFSEQGLAQLTPVNLDLSANTAAGASGCLHILNQGLFKKPPILFDIALPVFHGSFGENGGFQGLMEFANVAYAGMRAKAAQIFMDKDITKRALMHTGVPMLPHATIDRPLTGLLVSPDVLVPHMATIGFPCCVKPANLGSSIGVSKATNIDEVVAVLATIFKMDSKAIIEPFVPHLVEYNVAVRVNAKGDVETSAIERPKSSSELLDFKAKYLSSGGAKKLGGSKVSNTPSEGMLSLTREINPEMSADKMDNIRNWAVTAYKAFGVGGAPRIDFIGNSESGEIWLNELNPIPGSYGYFLWEASAGHILFTELLTDLLKEAEQFHRKAQLPRDPVPADARLLVRPT